MVHRNVEEALDLLGVEIDGQNAVHARRDEEVGGQLS